MKKIVFLNTSHIFGGVEKNFIVRASAFEKKGYVVQVVTGSRVIYHAAGNAGISRVRLIPCNNDYNLFFFVRFFRLLVKFRPDVVFLSTKRDFWRGGLPAKAAGIKRIVGYWGSDYSVGNKVKLDFIFRNVVHRLIVNSFDLRERLIKRKFTIEPEKIKVVYNGFDSNVVPDSLRQLDLRRAFNIPASSVLLGSAGRFVAFKQFELAFPVLRALRNAHDIRFVLVGNGPEMENLKAKAKECGVSDIVIFAGNIKDLFHTTFYSELDLFLFFSRDEGLPNVLIECLYYNTYALALEGPGIREVLTGKETGIVAKDLAEFQTSLSACLRGSLEKKNLRHHVEEKFSVKRMLEDTERVFFEE